jgi:pSer/pThr/pTyr-binding forkhead associated (FHA) protein
MRSLVGLAPPVQHFVFSTPQTCMIGRSPDCDVVLPATIEYCDVSRRHCALRIDPPFVHVRDLGSLNGTFVNDDRIGGRSPHVPPRKGQAEDQHDWSPLHDGDELRLGQHAILLLEIHEFVAEGLEYDPQAKDGVGSGTFNAYPD